jgi:hypothetical protein
MHRTILLAIALALASATHAEARVRVFQVGRLYAREYIRFHLSGHHAPRLPQRGLWRPLKIARFAPQ